MGIQIPPAGLTVSIGEDGAPRGEVTQTLLRLDLWPTWLEIGCAHAEQAQSAGDRLNPDLPDHDKFTAMTEELHAGLVAITAFAFAIDGFYDTLRNEMGAHPDHAVWRTKRTSRDAQVTETLRYRLKLGPKFSQQLRTTTKKLFDFRGRAVHPSSRFVRPNYRQQIDSGVHPHLLTFSGPHAVQCRALVLRLLDLLVERAAEVREPDVDTGWLDRGRNEIHRLSGRYPTAEADS